MEKTAEFRRSAEKVMSDSTSMTKPFGFCVGVKTKFTNIFVAWRLSWIQLYLTITQPKMFTDSIQWLLINVLEFSYQ